MTADDIRAIALSQPQASEAPHFEKTSFRVAKKIFCTLQTGQTKITLKLTPEDQHNLLEPGVIEPVSGAWGRQGWTVVEAAGLESERLSGLMRLAWATVAPAKLLKAQASG